MMVRKVSGPLRALARLKCLICIYAIISCIFSASLAFSPSLAFAETACPTPPPAQEAFSGIRPRYLASQWPMQVVDESAIAHNRDALNDLRIFSAQTTRLSDAVVDGDASAAQCLNRQFDAWAQANALLGPAPSAQGRFERLWALAGLSVSAFKLERSGYTLSPQTKEWLQRLAVLVQEEQRFSRSADATNMTLWAALGTGTVALLNDDQKLWLWSLGRVDNFLDHVQPDGIAPTELARRERATRYHFFAAQPLMAFDRIARCFGKPLDAEHVQSKERFLKLLRQLQRQQISLASQAGAEQLPYYRQVWFDILDKPKTASDDRDVHVDRLGGSIVAFSRASAC